MSLTVSSLFHHIFEMWIKGGVQVVPFPCDEHPGLAEMDSKEIRLKQSRYFKIFVHRRKKWWKRGDFRLYTKKMLSLHKNSNMNENIESVKKYNLWFGNTIDCGFPRPLYTESVAWWSPVAFSQGYYACKGMGIISDVIVSFRIVDSCYFTL